MRPDNSADRIWLLAAAALLGYEVYAITTGRETLSRSIWRRQRQYPLLSFALGLFMGHLETPGPAAGSE